MSLTVAIFYGFFVNLHNRNLDQSKKFANAINLLYAEVKTQKEQLNHLQEKLENLLDSQLSTQE